MLKTSKLSRFPQGDEITLYIRAAMFSLLCLIGAFGFFGSITKQRGLVSVFGSMLAVHLLLSVATGIWTIYTLFKYSSGVLVSNCIASSSDDTATATSNCEEGIKILKIIVVVAYAVSWLFELWGYLIVTSYVQQLREEEDANIVNPSASMSSYYQPNATYAPPPVTQPNAYPFTQPTQAMGYQA
ncbi:hypothetical protein HMN09_00535500 [Mycena chlorophos]|uniref:Uncharacterized protein n=1 Tax=Mycena chlorophos TaxID=658473 RepID=A0A8H6T8F7_MYCCL|nr:hypothetical protein HMN09_00535500 [Mycena chlorophos]